MLENINGSGSIDGSDLNSINGSASEIVQAVDALDTDPLTFDSTLTASAANANDINSIASANGSGSIDGTSVTEINGTADAVLDAVDNLDTAPSSFDSKLTGSADVTDIDSIYYVNGDGSIDGSALTDINGEASDVVAVLDANGGSLDVDPTSFDSKLTGSAEATDISSIEAANGNGSADGFSLTDINGTADAVVQAIDDLDTDPSFDSKLTGSADATDISSIEAANGNGSGMAYLCDIDGTAADVVQAIADVDEIEGLNETDNFDTGSTSTSLWHTISGGIYRRTFRVRG